MIDDILDGLFDDNSQAVTWKFFDKQSFIEIMNNYFISLDDYEIDVLHYAYIGFVDDTIFSIMLFVEVEEDSNAIGIGVIYKNLDMFGGIKQFIDKNIYYNCDDPLVIDKIVRDISNIKVTLNQMAKLSSIMPTKKN